MNAQQELQLASDILILSSSSVWTSRETNETLVNLLRQLKEQEIPLNFSIVYGTFFDVGGPNGIWSTRQIAGFEKCEKIPNVFTWKGSKEKRNDLEWFVCINYFNSQGNVYSMLPEEPYYEIVWKNRKITQVTGGTDDEGFHGCLLDNGQVWVLDYSSFGDLRDKKQFPIANDIGWTHLTFFDDKKVKCVLAMNSIVYVLCENPEQKLYYYSNTHFAEREKREGYPLVPAEDLYFSSKKIFKMVSLPEIVLCWCEEGLYSWLVSNGSSPLESALSNPVCTHPKKCFPFLFFSSKTILDIAVKKNFYILCDDGVYALPATLADDFDDVDFVKRYEQIIVPIKLELDGDIPVIFSSYLNSSKLGKSARSRIEPSDPPAKKQKLESDIDSQ